MVKHFVRRVSYFAVLALLSFAGCRTLYPLLTSHAFAGNLSFAPGAGQSLRSYPLLDNTHPLLDPAVIRQGDTYYVFSTDVLGAPTGTNLPIRCSQDQISWTACGGVFSEIPLWVRAKVPGIVGLWAPDISFFGGLYHVYYAGSTLGSQRSVIGMATNTTLDRTDPNYAWVDAGEVMASVPGDDSNAIDPNILVDPAGNVWLTSGSYWSGIRQRQIDPNTGMPLENTTVATIATRPGVLNNPIEGASIIHHGEFYYLFVSIDYCCNATLASDNYKEAVGRSASAHGPFLDNSGTAMLDGGGTVLLEGSGIWSAPGGGTAFVDPSTGESILVFHALKATENGAQYLWIKHIVWQNDWPVLL